LNLIQELNHCKNLYQVFYLEKLDKQISYLFYFASSSFDHLP